MSDDGLDGLVVDDLTHAFGARRVVDGVSFAVRTGEVHCLVGPSGCGKTTTLRLVAGLEAVQTGRITLAGQIVADRARSLPPERRRVGLMFQDYALFPHLSVRDNVSFGLRGMDGSTRRRRVDELLAKVNMGRHAASFPDTLSGGEQQRVALARALAPSPALMLLDEAFSSLDTTLRTRVREEALAVLRETGTPTLLVTHDAEEAVLAGDRIHAMLDGRIVQSGAAAELYARPLHRFVAGFFGPVNRYAGRVAAGGVATPLGVIAAAGMSDGAEVEVMVRPEAIRLGPASAGAATLARIVTHRDLGSMQVLELALACGAMLQVRQRSPSLPARDGQFAVDLDPAGIAVYPV